MRGRLALVFATEAALLALYYSQTGLWLSPRAWTASFAWEPISGPFQWRYFLAVAGLGVCSIILCLGWVCVAALSGRALLRLFAPPSLGRAQSWLLSIGLGTGLLSLGTWALALSGLLYGPAALTLGALAAAAGIASLRRARRGTPTVAFWRELPLRPPSLPRCPGSRLCLLLGLLGGIVLAFHLLGALLPPVSFDEMNYQLALPKLYLLNHGWVPTRFNHLSFLPQNINMLFTLGLISGGAETAKLLSWVMGTLAACALYVFVQPRLGRKTAFLGTCLFLLSPMVGNQLRLATTDLGTAFYELLGVFLLLGWMEKPEEKLLPLSSVFWGLALGSKYTALLGWGAAWAALIWHMARGRFSPTRALRAAAEFAAPALLLWSPWLLKNGWETGNPVAPLLSGLIPSGNFVFAGLYEPRVDYSTGLGIPNYFPIRSLGDLFCLPWDIATRHNDFNHEIGPALLLALSFCISARAKTDSWTRRLRGICGLYWVLWLVPPVRMARYFVAGLGITSMGVAWLISSTFQRGNGAKAFLLAALTPLGLALAQQAMRATWIQNVHKKPWGYLSGRCSLRDYVVSLHEEPAYDAIAFINARLPQDATILVIDEFRTYHLERNFIAGTPWDHDPWLELVRMSSSPGNLSSRLGRLGITALLGNDGYLLSRTGRDKSSAWTPEDRRKEREFLRLRSRVLHRSGGAWVAVPIRGI